MTSFRVNVKIAVTIYIYILWFEYLYNIEIKIICDSIIKRMHGWNTNIIILIYTFYIIITFLKY